MKGSQAISKEKLGIFVTLGVLVITVVAVAVFVVFEMRKSPNKEGRYMHIQQW